MKILQSTTCVYVSAKAVPSVAADQLRAEPTVKSFRLDRSDATPAPSEAMAKSDVKATEARKPYCASEKPISRFMALKGSALSEKSTR